MPDISAQRIIKKTLKGVTAAAAVLAAAALVSNHKEKEKNLDGDNPYITASIQKDNRESNNLQKSIYKKHIKRAIDIILSLGGLVLLSPLYAMISIAIVIDDPGPVFFTQKRVGKGKSFFMLHKFRSMKMSTPHDVPTHMLEDPDQYITSVGKFLRKSSLDELPQVWDIFRGKMSIIGPRPALWNQEDLVAEREIYGANDIVPGLTGWAQINGRDELEIEEKAAFDGEYVKRQSLMFDIKCFIGTVFSVANSEGVLEGGTGTMHGRQRPGVPDEDPETPLGCDLDLTADIDSKKHILVTGAGSYIGESFRAYAERKYPKLEIDTIDMVDGTWRDIDFSGYDCVYHVAGIAHADIGNINDGTKEKYYAVNTDLAIETAKKAKADGVNQFVFMSSIIVYGDSAPYGKEKFIDRNTKPTPSNFYGDSKWQADKGIRALADNNFKVAVLRPPMIYGRGSKGNYPVLAKMAKMLPLFPDTDNVRSMLYIDNLCEFLCKLIMTGEGGIYFPQNNEYTRTSDLVRQIASATGHGIIVSKALKPAVLLASYTPGKIGSLTNKAFGNSCYDYSLSNYSFSYIVNNLSDSIKNTEGTTEAVKKGIKSICIINCFDTYETRVDLLHDYFKRLGYEVNVFTSDFRHFEKRRRNDSKEDFTLFRAKPYMRNISADRLISHKRLASEICREVEKRSFDLLWVMAPPNSFVSEFARFKREHRNTKMIIDLIDLWPETMPVHGFRYTPAYKLWKSMRDANLAAADVVVTECELYRDKLPPAVKTSAHTLYLAGESLEYGDKPRTLPDDRIVLCYLGSVNNIIDIAAISKIITGLKQYKNVLIHIVGDGEKREELIGACKDAGAEVEYHGIVYDKEAKLRILSACHYGLNIMKDSVFVGLTMKSMDYFAAGLPILNNIKGDTCNFVKVHRIGYNISSDSDYSRICDYDPEMRYRARNLFETEFTIKAFEEKVAEILEEAIKCNEPSISVALAAYNGEKYIKEQIDSILSQLEANDELIISYNPSTDGTEQIVRQYANDDKRVKVYLCRDTDIKRNFENAISRCSNEIIFLSDQDDVWLPEKRKTVLKQFEDPELLAIAHGCYLTDKDLSNPIEYELVKKRKTVRPVDILWKNRMQGSCMAFRRSTLGCFLPFPDEIPMHDSWIGINISTMGKVMLIPERLLLYRQHNSNVTSRSHGNINNMIKQRARLLKAYLLRQSER